MISTISRVAAVSSFLVASLALGGCSHFGKADNHVSMTGAPKAQVVTLLKSLETGDMTAFDSINPDKYIQHNLTFPDGLSGIKAVFSQVPKGSAKVNTVRVFQDGDHVFAHSEYQLAGARIGFDIFRFENGKIVEHWDNLQAKAATPNPSGRSMIDGPVDVQDRDKTQANKAFVRGFVENVLINGRFDQLAGYFNNGKYLQHNPQIADDLSGLGAALQAMAKQGIRMKYERIHKVLGEGNFVLVASEGEFAGRPTSFYDLFRVQDGKIAEHWDTIEAIPPRVEWKNANGKF